MGFKNILLKFIAKEWLITTALVLLATLASGIWYLYEKDNLKKSIERRQKELKKIDDAINIYEFNENVIYDLLDQKAKLQLQGSLALFQTEDEISFEKKKRKIEAQYPYKYLHYKYFSKLEYLFELEAKGKLSQNGLLILSLFRNQKLIPEKSNNLAEFQQLSEKMRKDYRSNLHLKEILESGLTRETQFSELFNKCLQYAFFVWLSLELFRFTFWALKTAFSKSQ